MLSSSDEVKYERETSITFNELEDFATIYTSSKKMISTFKKLKYNIISQDKNGAVFNCPVSLILFAPYVRDNDKKPRKQTPKKNPTKPTAKQQGGKKKNNVRNK